MDDSAPRRRDDAGGPPTVIRAAPDFAPLVRAFVDDARADAARALGHLDRGELDAAHGIGHSVKGAGGGYGLDEATRLGGVLAGAAASGDGRAARRAALDLAAYLDAVVVKIEPGA